MTIKGLAYLEVKTQKPEITFLCEILDYTKLRQHIWYAEKNRYTYYIKTKIKNKTLQFHRLIYSEWSIIDHINREGYNNHEYNLRKTTSRENQLNCRLQINNNSRYNEVSYDKYNKK